MDNAQIVGLAFLGTGVLSILMRAVVPAVTKRGKPLRPVSGPEALILLEMAAALGWFLATLPADGATRLLACVFLVISTMPLDIALRQRRLGIRRSYAQPAVSLLYAVSFLLLSRAAELWEGLGAALALGTTFWQMHIISYAYRRPAERP